MKLAAPPTQGQTKLSHGKHCFTVHEGGRLYLPPHLNHAKVHKRLLKLNSTLPVDVFIADRRGIRISAVVGMVDIGICQIEILPKVSATSSTAENSQFLLDMLAASGFVAPTQFLEGHVVATNAGLLEPIIRVFAEDLWLRLVEGLPRRYADLSEVSPVLRGSIRFEAIATRPPGNDQVLPIRYNQLHGDNDLSRLILAVISRLQVFTRSLRTRRILDQCATLFEGLTPSTLTPEVAESVQTNRLETHWEPVVAFARALASNLSPDVVSAGRLPFFSILFSLDELFEAVLRKSLRLALKNTSLNLAAHWPTFPLLRSLQTGADVLRLRPDYLFVSTSNQTEKRLVGDAKWKRLIPGNPSFGLKPADAYQLTAYLTSHNLQKGIVFFPTDEWMAYQDNPWLHRFAFTSGSGTVTIAAVDVQGLVSKSGPHRKKALQDLQNAVETSLV